MRARFRHGWSVLSRTATIATIAAVAIACTGGRRGGGVVVPRDGGVVGTEDGAVGVAPVILSFQAIPPVLMETGEITFEVVASDADDLIAGGLLEDDGGASYGALESSAIGSWHLTLSWGDVHAIRAIEIGPEGEMRTFVARLIDDAGHETTATAGVRIACSAGVSACSGSCVDTTTSVEHCGTCGTACNGSCVAGVCHDWGECIETTAYASCNAYCASVGRACAIDCSDHDTAFLVYDTQPPCDRGPGFGSPPAPTATCDTSFFGFLTEPNWFRCCCAP